MITLTAYCDSCGHELTSLFCSSCGAISSNVPNSFSNDDSIAGLIANVVRQEKPLLFSEVLSLTKSLDRTYRIFSQLEKTRKFLIVKQSNDYLLTTDIKSVKNDISGSTLKTKDKLNIIKSLLEFFSLSQDDISKLFPLQVTFKDFVEILGSGYELKRKANELIVSKKK